MQMPLQISYHNLPPSDALSESIRIHAAKLEEHCPRLLGCKVAVEEPNHHHRQGKGRHFKVRLELSVPGELLIVDRDPPERVTSEDPYLAVAHAFTAARRQLAAFVRQHGRVRPHQRAARKSRPWIGD